MKGLGSSITKGLQTGSRLICNDNSGAKIVQIIGVKGAKAKRAMYPKVGVSDIVTVAVKKGSAAMKKRCSPRWWCARRRRLGAQTAFAFHSRTTHASSSTMQACLSAPR